MVTRMKLQLRCISLVIGMLFLTSSDVQALLNGTDVTGSLVSISLPTTNLFDVGFSSAFGCGNISDNTVVIGAGTEFCFLSSITSGVVVRFTDSANFTDNTLTLVWAVGPTNGESYGSFAKTYEFTNAAFAGLSITEQTDSFINGGMNCNLTSITLSCNWAGTDGPFPSAPYTHEAVYIFTAGAAVPEPSSLALLAFGLAAFGVARGWKHS